MGFIDCPLKKMKIEEYTCYEISMAAEGLAPSKYLSHDRTNIEKLKKICLKCPNHRED